MILCSVGLDIIAVVLPVGGDFIWRLHAPQFKFLPVLTLYAPELPIARLSSGTSLLLEAGEHWYLVDRSAQLVTCRT